MTSKPAAIWAYMYELEPPQSSAQLKEVRMLLEQEHLAAQSRSETWEGRFVPDERVSHILVLAEDSDLTGEINSRLEEALRAIHAQFHLSVPMIVPGGGSEGIHLKDE